MSKSLRNQLVEWADEALVALVDKDKGNKMFVESGFHRSATVEGKDGAGSFDISVMGSGPVMVLSCLIPLVLVSKALAPDFEFEEFEERVACSGYSKLKSGDTWSGYEGYLICCKRAARDFADYVLQPIQSMARKHVEIITEESVALDELNEAFYQGNFLSLDLVDDDLVDDEEE